MKKKLHLLVPAVALAVAGTHASAQVLYEPFLYTTTGTTGSPLDALNSDSDVEIASPGSWKHYSSQGTFWGRRGTDTGNVTVNVLNLSPTMLGTTVLPPSLGGSARLTTVSAGRTPSLGFAENIQSGSIYWSLQMKMNAVPTTSSTSGIYIGGINSFSQPGNELTTKNAGLRVRRVNPTDGTQGYQIGLTEYGDAVVWHPQAFQPTDTVFLVSRLNIGPITTSGGGPPADDTMDMWINPTANFGGVEGSVPTPDLTIAAGKDLNDSLGASATPAHTAFFFRTRTGTGPPFIDDIRVDKTWAGVTPDGTLQYTFNDGAGGSWSDTSKWNNYLNATGSQPNALGNVANLNLTGTVTVDGGGKIVDTINLHGGAVNIAGTDALTFSTNATAGQIVAWAGNHTISAPITLGSSDLAIKTATPPGVGATPSTITLSGPITGTGRTISMYGRGTVVLGAANVIASDMNVKVRSARLDLNGNNLNVASFQLGAGHTNDGSAIANSPDLGVGVVKGTGTITSNNFNLECGTVEAAVTLAGTNGVVKNNAATVTLAGNNTYTGDTVINSGTLILSGTNSNVVRPVINLQAGHQNSTLQISADSNLGAVPGAVTSDSITITSGATLRTTGTMALHSNRGITTTGTNPILINNAPTTTLTVNGVITGTAGVTQTGGGTTVLAAANTYAGATNVVGGTAGSTIRTGIDNAVPAGTTLGLNTLSAGGSATFDIAASAGGTAYNQTIAGLVNNSPAGGVPTVTNSGANAATLSISNPSTVSYSGNLTSTNLNVDHSGAADLILTGPGNDFGGLGGTGNTTIGGATGITATASHFRQNVLTVGDNSTAKSRAAADPTDSGQSATATSKVNSLVLGNNSKLNLTNGKLIVVGAAAGSSWNGTAYDGVAGLVQSGFNGGGWDGARGIVTDQSSAISPNVLTSLVTMSADEAGYAGGNFGGQSVASGDQLVMYSWGGDANMDGTLNGDDYFEIDSNIAAAGTVFGYGNGDFNYDGDINGDDYFIIDSNIAVGQSATPFATAGGAAGLTAVPEPASIGVLAIAACGLAARRRRQR